MRYSRILLGMAGAAMAVPSAPIEAQQPPEDINEWMVPWAESRPRDPYVGPDGRVWFVGQRSHYAAYLDPVTGQFEKFELDDETGPHNLIVDDDGTVYYAGNRVRHIGKLDPETGAIEKFWMPEEQARDPHTLVFDHDGNIWFTVQQGNFIGHFAKETGEVRLVEAPEVEGGRSSSSRPYGIKIDSRNRPWIALFNTNQIAMVDPGTMRLTAYDLPEGARPRRLGITSDDMIWYTDYRRGYLGRLNPETGEVSEWPNPGGEQSRPYGMAIDGDDRIWFVDGIRPKNRFIGFDPETEEYFSITEIESGGGTVRHMYYHKETNTIWFGADTNTIGRMKVPPKRRNVS